MTVWQLVALQLLAVYAGARLLELLGSSLRLKARQLEARIERRPTEAPVPERAWPWFVATHTLVLVGSAVLVVARGWRPPHALFVGALGALWLAAMLRLWVLLTLRGRWNVRVVDPGEVATGGPYQYIRHPNYLAVILEVAALPLAVGAPEIALVATIANAVLLARRIPLEEHALAERHPEYRNKIMRLPRFLPRV